MAETLTANSLNQRSSTKWLRRLAFVAAGVVAGAGVGAGATAYRLDHTPWMGSERTVDHAQINADAICSAAVKRAAHIDSFNMVMAQVSELTPTELDTCTDNPISIADRGFRMGSEESQVSFWYLSSMAGNRQGMESDLSTITPSSDTLPDPMGGFALAGGILALGLSGRRRGQTAA